MLVMPLRMLGMWIGQAQRATAAGERIFELLDEPEEIADQPERAAAARPGPGPSRSEGVDVRLRAGPPGPRGHRARDRSPAKRSRLIGRTGSGKTTLAALVPRFYDATAGRVLVDGTDVRDLERRSLRREIGVISQDPFLFSASIRDNIAFGMPDAPARRRRGRRAGRASARVHPRAPAGLRHGRGRARDHALGRAAAAHRHRPRAPHRPADPRPRRRDRVGGRDDRGSDPGGPARGHAGPDDDHHRPPPVHDRARRRDRRARSRADRRAGDAGRAPRGERALPRDPRARAPPAGGRADEGVAAPGLCYERRSPPSTGTLSTRSRVPPVPLPGLRWQRVVGWGAPDEGAGR